MRTSICPHRPSRQNRRRLRRRFAAAVAIGALVAAGTVGPASATPLTNEAGAAPLTQEAGATSVTQAAEPRATAANFSDDFADGDPAGWAPNGGQWAVTDDDGSPVYRQRLRSADARTSTGDPAWSDYRLTARVKPTGFRHTRSSVELLARVRSHTSYYYLVLRPAGELELGKVVSGRATTLATTPADVTVGAWHTLRFSVIGNTLTGLLGTTTSVTATDTEFSTGRIGLATSFAAGSFDDVVVAPPPDNERPSQPGKPQVLDVTPTTVTIDWAPSTDNVGVVDYFVYQSDQFYGGYVARIVTNADPITLNLSPTAARSYFWISARDAAGNTSQFSDRTSVPQPPSFPRSGDETEPPTAPGAPIATGVAPDGGIILTWAPATDNVGVVEYHVLHTFNIDEVRLVAKVSTNSATVVPRGYPLEFVTIIAYDAAWNSSYSSTTPLEQPPRPTPTAPTTSGSAT